MQYRPLPAPTIFRTDVAVPALTDAQLAQLDEAIRDSQRAIEAMRRRLGEPLPASWRILREIREESPSRH